MYRLIKPSGLQFVKGLATRLVPLLALLVGCNSSAHHDSVRVTAEEHDRVVLITIANESANTVNLTNPTYAVTLGQAHGLDIQVLNTAGDRINACAMVDPPNTAQENIVKLDPEATMDQKMDVGTITRRYCLGSGTYKVTFTLKQPHESHESNTVNLAVD